MACVDGDLVPAPFCRGHHLTPVAVLALLLAGIVPASLAGVKLRWRAVAVIVLCVLVPFVVGYVHIGAR